MMTWILAEAWPYIAGVGAAALALLFAFMRGRSSAEQDAQSNKYDAMKDAQEVRRDVEAMDDDNLAAEFDRLREQRRR